MRSKAEVGWRCRCPVWRGCEEKADSSKEHLGANTQHGEGDSEGMARVAADARDGEVQVPGVLRARVPAARELAVVMAWRSVNYSLPAALPFVIPHTLFHSRQLILSPSLSRVSLCHIIMRSSTSLLRGIARSTAPRTARVSHAERIPALAKRLFHTPRTSAAIRPSLVLSRARLPSTVRFESSAAPPTSTDAPDSRLEREQVPSYELTFTCNVCKTRSSHRLSKQGYHHGTVLIQCPGCKNRHLIADHLKV